MLDKLGADWEQTAALNGRNCVQLLPTGPYRSPATCDPLFPQLRARGSIVACVATPAPAGSPGTAASVDSRAAVWWSRYRPVDGIRLQGLLWRDWVSCSPGCWCPTASAAATWPRSPAASDPPACTAAWPPAATAGHVRICTDRDSPCCYTFRSRRSRSARSASDPAISAGLLSSSLQWVTTPSGPSHSPATRAASMSARTRASSAGSAANSTRSRTVSPLRADAVWCAETGHGGSCSRSPHSAVVIAAPGTRSSAPTIMWSTAV